MKEGRQQSGEPGQTMQKPAPVTDLQQSESQSNTATETATKNANLSRKSWPKKRKNSKVDVDVDVDSGWAYCVMPNTNIRERGRTHTLFLFHYQRTCYVLLCCSTAACGIDSFDGKTVALQKAFAIHLKMRKK